jgi:hypothetical protein
MFSKLIPAALGLVLVQIGLPLWIIVPSVFLVVSLVIIIGMFKTLMNLPEEIKEVKKEAPHGSFTGNDLKYMPR